MAQKNHFSPTEVDRMKVTHVTMGYTYKCLHNYHSQRPILYHVYHPHIPKGVHYIKIRQPYFWTYGRYMQMVMAPFHYKRIHLSINHFAANERLSAKYVTV